MEKLYLEGLVDRSFEASEETRAAVEKSRTIRFIISSSAKDRHRTVLNMDGWQLDNYGRNPVVGYQHNLYGDNMCVAPNPDDVIGKSRVWIQAIEGDKKVLMGEVTFETADLNPLAEKIFRKILAGTLSAASVGFLEIGKGKKVTKQDEAGNVVDSTYFFQGQELLEWSIVNIPSNAEATKKSMVNHTRAGVNFLRNAGMKISVIRKVVNEMLDELEAGEDPDSGDVIVDKSFTIAGDDLYVAMEPKKTESTGLGPANYKPRRKSKSELTI